MFGLLQMCITMSSRMIDQLKGIGQGRRRECVRGAWAPRNFEPGRYLVENNENAAEVSASDFHVKRLLFPLISCDIR